MDLRNPMIRRVQRHCAVATLFRTWDPVVSPHNNIESLSLAESEPPVATLLPPSASLPTGHVIGLAPDTGHSASRVQLTPVPSPAAAPEIPSRPDASPESDDAGWRRLQTIFRRHQEKNTAEEMISSDDPAPASTSRASEPAQGPLPVRKTIQSRTEAYEVETPSAPAGEGPRTEMIIAPEMAQPARTQRTESPVQPTAEVPDAGLVAMPPAPPTPLSSEGERRVSDRVAQEAPGPESVESAAGAGRGDSQSPARPIIQRTPAPGATRVEPAAPPLPEATAPDEAPLHTRQEGEEAPQDVGATPPAELSTAAVIQEDAPDRALGAQSPTQGEDDVPAKMPTHSLPLQAVWPVQRQDEPLSSAASEPPERASPAPPAKAQSPGTGETRHSLEDVAPAHPTDSPVEITLPRRPRPVLKQAEPEAGIGPERGDVEPGQVDLPTPATMEHQPPTEASRSLASPPAESRLAPGVQMWQGDATHGDQAHQPPQTDREPELVKTEVGPLPADLWHLLGQSPPEEETLSSHRPLPALGEPAAREESVSPASSSRHGSATLEVSRHAERAEMAQGTPTGGDLFIQRQPAVGESEKEVARQQSPDETLDTDELARQVYAQIKRRLSVEWERARRRF